jgi:hypothetical protein
VRSPEGATGISGYVPPRLVSGRSFGAPDIKPKTQGEPWAKFFSPFGAVPSGLRNHTQDLTTKLFGSSSRVLVSKEHLASLRIRRTFRRETFLRLAAPDQTVPYGTAPSRDAFPGTSCLAWSLAVKELGRSVKHSGTELWLEFLRVVVQGGVGPEVGKRFGSNRCVP